MSYTGDRPVALNGSPQPVCPLNTGPRVSRPVSPETRRDFRGVRVTLGRADLYPLCRIGSPRYRESGQISGYSPRADRYYYSMG